MLAPATMIKTYPAAAHDDDEDDDGICSSVALQTTVNKGAGLTKKDRLNICVR